MVGQRFHKIQNFFKGFDWWLIAAVFLLCLFGLAALYSVGLGRPDSSFLDFKKQIVFFFLGVILMLLASRVNVSFYFVFGKAFYFFSLLLLLALFFFGANIKGTKGWFVLGGFSFQPVEFAKVALILILGNFASRQARSFKTLGFFFGSAFLVLLPTILIILQPDLGSALLLGAIWLTLILVSGVKKKYLLASLLVFCFSFFISWVFLLKDYQKERFLTFINPAHDPFGRGYNVIQSMIAVGSGKLLGRGLGFGSQSQLRFLPENQTDFIFAVVAEEMGFVGVILVLSFFALLFFRLFQVALTARDDFSLFVVLGVLGLFFTQFIINIGMNIGLLPVTGITLPFLSAGGSSLLANFLLIGIIQSVNKSKKMIQERLGS